MKNRKIILIILLTAVAAGTAGLLFKKQQASGGFVNHPHKESYYCPMHPQYTSDRPGTCPICQMKLVKKEQPVPSTAAASTPTSVQKILYWTDPMIPGYKASGPGKSPMGMDLVPVYEEGAAAEKQAAATVPGYSMVTVEGQKQQIIGIKTALVTKQNLVKTIHAYGYVAHDLELYDAQLAYIEAWRAYYPFLYRRESRDEYHTDWRKYYKQSPAQSRWRSDEKVKAQQQLLKAEYELIHLGLTETQLRQLRQIKYGQLWVQPDLLFFDENNPKWIYAQIPENDLGFISVGQNVVVTIPTYGEKTAGIVKGVAPVVDPATRTTRVRVELPDYRGELSVNMFADVDFPVELDASLVIPREAMMDLGLSKIVFVQVREGVFEPRRIETGMDGDGMVAVKSGLNEGEVIVTSGNFLLDSESRLQASLMEGMEGMEGGQHD